MTGVARGVTIDRYVPGCADIEALTDLIHRAYARLSDAGYEYVAATQPAEKTRFRIEFGTSWLARDADRIVGTISFYPGTPVTKPYPEWYDRDDVGFFGQFAVDPACSGRGIGDLLLETVYVYARSVGKKELACDTTESVRGLVRYYMDRGFRVVGRHVWPGAAHTSVVLSKAL